METRDLLLGSRGVEVPEVTDHGQQPLLPAHRDVQPVLQLEEPEGPPPTDDGERHHIELTPLQVSTVPTSTIQGPVQAFQALPDAVGLGPVEGDDAEGEVLSGLSSTRRP